MKNVFNKCLYYLFTRILLNIEKYYEQRSYNIENIRYSNMHYTHSITSDFCYNLNFLKFINL